MAQVPVLKTLSLDDSFAALFATASVLSGTLEAPLGNANAIELRVDAGQAQDWPAGTAAYLEQVDFSRIQARDPQDAGGKLVFVGQSCPA